jgi:serine/threonine-protein kinase
MSQRLRAPLATLAGLLVLWALHLHHYLPRLPERVATHFGGAGAPNGWMSRAGLQTFDLVFTPLIVMVVVAVGLLTSVLPPSFINVPHRDHWFAPERRRDSHARLFAHMVWLACLIAALLIGVNHLTFQANLGPGPAHLSGAGLVGLLVGFVAALVVWIVRLHRMFPAPR